MEGSHPPVSPTIRLRVFGGLELVRLGGKREMATQSKRVALFAYLTLAEPRGLQRRDSFLPLFWPEFDQSRARAALRQSIYYLRRALDEDVFLGEGDETLGIDHAAVDCDALSFQAALERGELEAALTLYAGKPFAGFHFSGMDPGLEDWFHATSASYRSAAADAARTLAERDIEEVPANAAEWAKRAMAIDSEDEGALRLRIRAQAMAGDRLGALRTYREFEEWLQVEYAIEPSGETQEVIEEIRSAERSAETPPAAVSEQEPIILPLPAGRRRTQFPMVLVTGVALIACLGWVFSSLTRSEAAGEAAGIRDPAPEAPFVEPQLGGLHDLRIVFSSTRDGNSEIYTINADGTELERVTQDPAADWEPRWTPDGRILFRSDRRGDHDIYVMEEDGGAVRQLTDHPESEVGAVMSPDGSKIAFKSARDGIRSAPYLMNSDGSGVRRLMDAPASAMDFSPDGTRLALGSFAAAAGNDRNSDIFVLDLVGTEPPIRLTDAWSYDDNVSWSPDGKKIAFRSGRDGLYNHEIYVMDADGSGQTNLTRTVGHDMFPRWSPDGSMIFFVSERGGGKDIYVMGADGSDPRRITRDGGTQPDVRERRPLSLPCLMLNGSFEEVTGARRPPGSDAFEGVPGWRAHDALRLRSGEPNSPDLFEHPSGVPRNRFGYQFPAEGRRYAGFATGGSTPPGGTEALGGSLREALVPGQTYEMRASVSNGDAVSDWNFLEVYLHSTSTGASIRIDTLTSSNDQTWTRIKRRFTISPGDSNGYDEVVFRGSYPRAKPAGYWYIDDVDVCPVD